MSVEEVSIKQWAHRGNMYISTDCLDGDDPMHPYNQLLAKGVVPEEYGVSKPILRDTSDDCD